MNDLSQPPILFTLSLLTEEVETQFFGTVIVRELTVPALSEVLNSEGVRDPDVDLNEVTEADERTGWKLVCACVRGSHGEQFTLELLANLPARALRDLSLMTKAATRVNGLSSDAVGKA
jgi:hypothetical protein